MIEMATTEEVFENPHNSDENVTNGSTSRLEYSGLSEDNLNVSETNDSIAKEIAHEFNEELDEHGAPAPSAKAIKRDIHENHAFSDDEFPKTLTTLETVKKPTQSAESDEIEICPIETEDDDFEEEPILLEVYNEDDENKDDESVELQKTPAQETNRRERKQQFNILTNHVRTPKLNSKSNVNDGDNDDESIVTPNKPIPAQSAGTIEIPRELITSDANIISPIIINHIKSPAANNDDLIAILEGDDNGSVTEEHYELSLSGNKATNGESKLLLTAEEEREIAMEQIMSLPKKKKGRPKLNQALKAARDTKIGKKGKNALVSSLVSDWDENEAKTDEATEIVVEIRPQEKQAIVEPVQLTFRRSRIIKKKIIWDPDAPETAINYASLAHTSGAGPMKRQRKSNSKKSETSEDIKPSPTDTILPCSVPVPKKKKTSEIDKLLGDEGAANMLNSLHQGNNNNNKIDGTSPGKIPRVKPIKTEPCNPQNASTPTVKGKIPKSKEVKEQSPQKQPQMANKKNLTPKSVAAGKKRGPKTSESWDYIYKSRPDDCMIIRRRSNSSYSSTASLNRMSIDLPNAPLIMDLDASDNDHEIEVPTKRSRSQKEKNQFEFAKPKAKKFKSEIDTNASTFDEARNSTTDMNNVFSNHKTGKTTESNEIDFGDIPIKLENGNDKSSVFSQIQLCRFEHFTQIILHSDNTNSEFLLSIQMLKEIEAALHSLESDKSCKLVLMTSAGEHFCNGVDYSSLVQSTGEKRRMSAIELSKKLSNFIQTLASFKKPLVAYVKGVVNGLGARMLPLFDVVYAESNASFSVKSQDYGEIVEGTALVSTTDKIDYNAKAKLLFLTEVMDAEEAKDCNVVAHVLKNDRSEQRVLIECNKLATNSILTLETCRLIQQQNVLPKLKDSLKIEQKQLLQHWTKSNFMDKLNAQQH